MSNIESFELIVKSKAYNNGIKTSDFGIVDENTRYGLEKLSEALYISAKSCAERHGNILLMKIKRGD